MLLLGGFFCSIVYSWLWNLLVSPLQSDALCHAVQQRYRGEFIAFDCRLLQLAVWFTSVSLQGWRVRVFHTSFQYVQFFLSSFIDFLPACFDQTQYVPTFARIILGNQLRSACTFCRPVSIGYRRHYGSCCHAIVAGQNLGYTLTK